MTKRRQSRTKEAAISMELKGLKLLGPSTSTPDIPSSSYKPAGSLGDMFGTGPLSNLRSIVGIFGIGPLSDTDVKSVRDCNTETFIRIHNIAMEKFSRIFTREYFCKYAGRSDEFRSVQTQHKPLGQRRDLIVDHNLSELEIGERNELSVLYGQLCVDPFRFGRIYTVMKEAHTEHGIALSIVAPDSFFNDQSYATKYPKGTKIAVKQPHLVKAPDGYMWLDIDNPRSIVRIERFPEISPKKFQDWFDKGRRAHDAEDWEVCVRNYTKCEITLSLNEAENREVESSSNYRMSLRFQLHSDRSRAYLGLGQNSDALLDAEICCEMFPHLDADAFLKPLLQVLRLRIESLLSLGNYKNAYRFLEDFAGKILQGRVLVLEETKPVVHFYRQKCIEYYRMGEAIAGIGKSPKDCKPDADFIGPVEIKDTDKGKGRGLFATELVKAGAVLLICRALARCEDYSYPLMHVPMSNGLVQNVLNKIDQAGDHVLTFFISLDPSDGNLFKAAIPTFSGFFFLDNAECQSTWSNHMFIRGLYENLGIEGILRILTAVAFDDMSPENINNWRNPAEQRRYYGIWLIPSLINHSCLPNASRINVGDVMSIHATKDINKGEEITIPYFNVLLPYQVRKAACSTWGFTCVCERCQLEGIAVPLDDPRSNYEKFLSAFLKVSLPKTNVDSFESSLHVVEAMGMLSGELDGWLESLGRVLGEQESMWIRSSFILPCLVRLQLNLDEFDRLKYEENAYRKIMNNITTFKQALIATCPGDIRRLLLDCRSMAIYRQIAASQPEYEGLYQRTFNINKSFDCVYGCQKPKTVQAILRKLSNSSILSD